MSAAHPDPLQGPDLPPRVLLREARPGPYRELLLCAEVARREAKNGNPYLALTLRDETAAIAGRLWDGVEFTSSWLEVGQVLDVSGRIEDYKGARQLRIDNLALTDALPAAFLPQPPGDVDAWWAELSELFKEHITDLGLRATVAAVIQRVGGRPALTNTPAAVSFHRAHVGGWLRHTLAVVRMALAAAAEFPSHDRGLLVAGAILHDIGKAHELNGDTGLFKYTTAGNLLGHVFLGAHWVAEEARTAGLSEETSQRLQHLMLSHHGELEHGAPVLPQTPEAVLLSEVDRLVSRLEMVDEARAGASSEGWTEWVRPLRRRLYFGASRGVLGPLPVPTEEPLEDQSEAGAEHPTEEPAP